MIGYYAPISLITCVYMHLSGERERERESERERECEPTLTTNEETESGSSRVVDDRTSFSRKQNRDIFGKLLYSNGEEQRGQITTSLAHSKHYLYYPLQYVYPYITFPKLNSITVVSSDQKRTHVEVPNRLHMNIVPEGIKMPGI